ncbi:MAG: A24 family peptidase [Vicinamibacterales bacterium]
MTTSSALVIALAFGGGALGNFLAACIRDLPARHRIEWPAKRSSPYLIIESLTAILCVGALWHYGPTLLFVSRVVLGCALIVLFAIDLEHRLLPNAITLPGVVIGFLFSFVTDPGWPSSLVGIALCSLPFAVGELYYRIRGRDGLGMGDVKMLAMIGAFLGWPAAILTLMLASITGSLVGLTVIALRRGDLQYALPFGTFLAVSAALMATVAAPLVNWLQHR